MLKNEVPFPAYHLLSPSAKQRLPLACVVDGHNIFVFDVIALVARSGCHTCKDPVYGTAIRRPFECGAIIVAGGLQS